MTENVQTTQLPVFDPAKYEQIWQKYWEDHQYFQNVPQQYQKIKEKFYLLFAFAYPSGSGLHVGHVESKTALDILARYYRMKGKEVFFPVGWDAFGLPAENYAVKTGIHPVETTKAAINTFRRQIKRLAISYDWGNELATNHPGYYQWTQWLFLKLYEAGLAYQDTGMVNWCPSCQTVLANEQVVDGACERCGTLVVQKSLKQWYFKITKYQDELISGLDQVDWPAPTKHQQLNWIGRKTGINITYPVENESGKRVGTVTCFTTRPDTNFGATFIVLAPEHELSQTSAKSSSEVFDYIERATHKTELERQKEGRKKTGVFTGLYALNHLTEKRMPVWISDFVLGGFGTGAVVGVPGHDLRDFEFAQAFNLEIKRVVIGPDLDASPISSDKQVQEAAGTMVNSDFLDGLPVNLATEKMMDHLEQRGWGKRVTTYKLRDWLISRQRYWGAPIPIIYDPDGAPHPVDTASLPWLLPTDVDFKPTGESPLKSSLEFKRRTIQYAANHFGELIKKNGWEISGEGWLPEYDTMDTFVDSSWYYLRFADARNVVNFADPLQLKTWLPVDFYMIGPEHIVLHLLYSRFFTKFLRDQGYLQFDEPFLKMRHQGMILGPDGKKMSKSKGNVINPDEIIEKFGADTLRIYEMFMGPIEADKPWDPRAVAGVYRFLSRIDRLIRSALESKADDHQLASEEVTRKFHQTLSKLDHDIPQLKFNTAVASMMEFINLWEKQGVATLDKQDVQLFITSLAPFAPFLAEELFQTYAKDRGQSSVHLQDWPRVNEDFTKNAMLNLPVQINGKVRDQLQWSTDQLGQEYQTEIIKAVLELKPVQRWLAQGKVRKALYIKGKIVSLVVDYS